MSEREMRLSPRAFTPTAARIIRRRARRHISLGYVNKAALNLAQADCVAARRLDGLRVDCQCRRHSASGCAMPEDPEWALATWL